MSSIQFPMFIFTATRFMHCWPTDRHLFTTGKAKSVPGSVMEEGNIQGRVNSTGVPVKTVNLLSGTRSGGDSNEHMMIVSFSYTDKQLENQWLTGKVGIFRLC